MLKLFFSRSVVIGVVVVILEFIVFSACSASYEDLTKSNTLQSLSLPQADYNVAIWLDEAHLIFEYAYDPNAKSYEEELALYDLELEDLRPFPFEKPTECFTGWYGYMARLPDGSFGFMYKCFVLETKGPGRIYNTLYIWDVESKSPQIWLEYPDSFLTGEFSFAPDMSELIQERPRLNSRLYRVDQDGKMVRLFPHFWRVGSPSWSPDGSLITFTGTETGPSDRSSIFTGLVELGNVLFYPWDIYLMNADGTDVRILLSDIEGANDMEWSPNGEWLAFRGSYDKTPGIWILNVASHQLIRIWSFETAYDWSPNGKQMVIMDHRTETDNLGRLVEYGYPVIIDLPIASLETE